MRRHLQPRIFLTLGAPVWAAALLIIGVQQIALPRLLPLPFPSAEVQILAGIQADHFLETAAAVAVEDHIQLPPVKQENLIHLLTL